ncbi:MAG: host attachment protein [Rhizomicrobium sp.]
MSNNEIWVVVATDASGARILANTEGTSRVLETLATPPRPVVERNTKVVNLLHARRPGATLARQIMCHLIEGAIQGCYEGLVIVASPDMTRELRLAMDRRVFDLVLGEIIEDAPVSAGAARRSA